MRFSFILSVFIALTFNLCAQQVYPLWPNGQMPNSKGLALKDSIHNDRLYVVAKPDMMVYAPAKEDNRHFAVLVIAGGGYTHITIDADGKQIAKYLNTIGATAFVLKYRLPNSPDLIHRELGPLQDGQRAMKIIRSLATKYHYDANKIGVLGTSAGGHLASSLGVFTQDYTDVKDSLYKYSFTPNFMVLISPVITMADPYVHKGSRTSLLGENPSKEMIDKFSTNLHVTDKTPPAIIFLANNDPGVPVYNSILFYEALHEKKVSASLHIFPYGKHAIIHDRNASSNHLWMPILENWLKDIGY